MEMHSPHSPPPEENGDTLETENAPQSPQEESEVRRYTYGHSGVRAATGTEYEGQDVFDSNSVVSQQEPQSEPPAPPQAQAVEEAPVPEESAAPVAAEQPGLEGAMQELAGAIHRAAGLLNQACGTMPVGSNTRNTELSARAFTGGMSVAMGAQKELDMGPLGPLMRDETVNDILINGPYDIFVERGGKVERTDAVFEDHQALFALAENIVRAVGRRLDPRRPLVDARLLDGSRVNIVAPPLAVDGISMSIRKFARERITLETMLEAGTISPQLVEFLKVAGRCKINMVICGGTGSGKTTMLNAISNYIGKDERIVTIEDSAELQLQQPHVVRLETKDPETRGKKDDEVSMRDLVKNALRMRPDRIIVGEVRGPEAFDMIQAMNTGHDGSLTTIHANTPRDGLARIENMVSMSSMNIPTIAIRKQIASAINLIIQTGRMEDGVRRITEVAEVVGMEGEIPTMQELFKFKSQGTGPDGKLQGQQVWSQVFPRNNGLTTALREAGVFKL